MSLWEPFSEPARRLVVRAQEVAQMFGAHFIGTEHMIFALGEGDDAVGQVLANAVDREALRERLGTVSRSPTQEMVFTPGSKRSIELAFESARRLNHNFIGTAHLAMGIILAEPPPLLAAHQAGTLLVELEHVATHDEPPARRPKGWRLETADPDPAMAAGLAMAARNLIGAEKEGTRITVTVAVPGEAERTWTWVRDSNA
jgi:ATP-dependent Clp protease ATP-binding subunit ClpA